MPGFRSLSALGELDWEIQVDGLRLARPKFASSATDGPAIMIIDYPPEYLIPGHTHGSDYCALVIAGSVQMSGRRYGLGDMRIVEAGTAYVGRAGPEGCRVVEFFERASGEFPRPLKGSRGPFGLERVVAALVAASNNEQSKNEQSNNEQGESIT